jgi:hypothetical protein
MICCAESTPRPGTCQVLDRLLVLAEQTCDLLVQSGHLLLDKLQFLERHLDQLAVDRVEFGTGTQRIAQLCRRGAQTPIGQGRQSCRIGFSIGQCLQHPPRTQAQQIRDQTRQLDMGLFQQCF